MKRISTMFDLNKLRFPLISGMVQKSVAVKGIGGVQGVAVKAPQWAPRPSKKRAPIPAFLLKRRYGRPVFPEQKPAIKEKISQRLKELGEIQWNPVVLLNLFLAACLLVSAVSVVYFSYMNRQHVAELAELRQERDSLQQEWSYLMKDQNSLSEFSRIEQTASSQMQMVRPDKENIYIIRRTGV